MCALAALLGGLAVVPQHVAEGVFLTATTAHDQNISPVHKRSQDASQRSRRRRSETVSIRIAAVLSDGSVPNKRKRDCTGSGCSRAL